MYLIETERLKLIPLNLDQLLLYQNDRPLLEKQLGLQPSDMQIDPAFKIQMNDALINFWLPNVRAYPDLYPWHTNWEIISKDLNTSIGSISFNGYPNDQGETLVAYMIDRQHRGNGYASEALERLIEWGFTFSILRAINADTTYDNKASQQVLIKTGFVPTRTEGDTLYYKLTK